MRRYMLRPLNGVILLLASLAPGAQAVQDQLQLVNAGAYYPMGGVYTSPYGVSINGAAAVLLICDDFTTDVTVGQIWTASVTSFADLQAGTNPAGTPTFNPGSPAPLSVIQNYATAAVLSAELMSLPSFASETAGEYSYALWSIFDTSLLNSTTNAYGTLSGAELKAAQKDLSDAQAMVAGATTGNVVDLSKISIGGLSINGLTIYTPDPLFSSQEFLQVSMPEPSSHAVLAVDLLAIAGLIVVLRRRMAGIFS